MKKLSSPHDTYFGTMMEHLEVARSFFQAYLPPKLVEAIDWSTLRIDDSVRRLPGRKPLQTDITYHCLTKDTRDDVFLHAEQERGLDAMIWVRQLQYNTGLYVKYQKQGNEKLPVIANVVVYNGVAQRYPYVENIYDYFARPDLAQEVLQSPFILLHLQKESDVSLASHGAGGLMTLLLKRAPERNFPEWMRAHKELFQNLPVDRYLESNLDYILQAGDYELEEIVSTLEAVYPHLKEQVMTPLRQLETRALQQGMQRGIQQGMQQGIQQGMQQVAKSMFSQLHLDLETIKQVTGLGQDELKRLQKEATKLS